MQYDKVCLETFLEKQSQLFDEPVAENLEEADAFLEDSMAVVKKDMKEVKKYFKDNMDITECLMKRFWKQARYSHFRTEDS